jgi:hypothetical protein
MSQTINREGSTTGTGTAAAAPAARGTTTEGMMTGGTTIVEAVVMAEGEWNVI